MTIQTTKTVEHERYTAPVTETNKAAGPTTGTGSKVRGQRLWNKKGVLRWALLGLLESAASVLFVLLGMKWLQATGLWGQVGTNITATGGYLLVLVLSVASGSGIGKMIRSCVGKQHFEW